MAINPADITTVRVGQLPPDLPTLESNIAHELGDILYKCTIQELVDLLSLNVGTLQYEQKTLHVTQEYIDTNFDETGLGRNICTGFAIINGNNGTPYSIDGLVEVGYGTNYNVIGDFDGEKEHTLIENEVPIISIGWTGQEGTGFPDGSADSVAAGDARSYPRKTQQINYGGGQSHNNMQPYVVALKIMKL